MRASVILKYLQNWYPSSSWVPFFAKIYRTITQEGSSPGEKLQAWSDFAIMLGNSASPELCFFVSLYGQSKVPAGTQSQFVGHIGRLSDFWEVPDEAHWLDDQLTPFDGDLQRISMFCLRLAAIRLGVLGRAWKLHD